MVAIVRPYQPSVTTNPTPFSETRAPNDRSGEMLGAAISELGEAAWVMEDELATAHAYQTDAEWTDFLRQVQYGDGGNTPGYLQMKGTDAINGRDGVVSAVEAKYRELVEGLNPRVRAGAVRSMEARYQTFIRSVNTHAASSASAARAGAAAAREKVSGLAAYEALANGDIPGFEQQAAAIRASIEEDPKYIAADEDARKLMVWKRLEPLYAERIDEAMRVGGASEAMAVANQARASGYIGPSTWMNLNQQLGPQLEIESAVASVESALSFGGGTPAPEAPAPATFDYGNLPMAGSQ